MKKVIERYNTYFTILLEAEKDGAHFALGEVLYGRSIADKALEIMLPYDAHAMMKQGGYYLIWGPTEDPEYKCHGFTPLRHPDTNKKWPLKKAMKEFMDAVKNSEKQSFHYTDQH